MLPHRQPTQGVSLNLLKGPWSSEAPAIDRPLPRLLLQPRPLTAASTHLLLLPPVPIHPLLSHPLLLFLLHHLPHLKASRTDQPASLHLSPPALPLRHRRRSPSPPGSLFSTPATLPSPNHQFLLHLHLISLPLLFLGTASQTSILHRPLQSTWNLLCSPSLETVH